MEQVKQEDKSYMMYDAEYKQLADKLSEAQSQLKSVESQIKTTKITAAAAGGLLKVTDFAIGLFSKNRKSLADEQKAKNDAKLKELTEEQDTLTGQIENLEKSQTEREASFRTYWEERTRQACEIEGETLKKCNDSSLEVAFIPSEVHKIEYKAFEECLGLHIVVIPNTVLNIGAWAFTKCINLKCVKFYTGTNQMLYGHDIFEDCSNLENVSLPENLQEIKYGMFDGCTNLRAIHIPQNVKSIEADAFFRCRSLESIDIPVSVTSIGPLAFSGCTSLKIVSKDNKLENVTELEDKAFEDCLSLEKLVFSKKLTKAQHVYEDKDGKEEYSPGIKNCPKLVVTLPEGPDIYVSGVKEEKYLKEK